MGLIIWFALQLLLTMACAFTGAPGWLVAIFLVADLLLFIQAIRRI